MKGGIEHSHLGNVGEQLEGRIYTGDIVRDVQGSQGSQLTQRGCRASVQQRTAMKLFAPVNHAMSNRMYLGRLRHYRVGAGEKGDHRLDRCTVIQVLDLCLIHLTFTDPDRNSAFAKGDPLNGTGGKRFSFAAFHEMEGYGVAPAIENKDIHTLLTL